MNTSNPRTRRLRLTICGDIHGKLDIFKNQYYLYRDHVDLVVGLGDLGFHEEYTKFNEIFKGEDRLKILQGNHDDPSFRDSDLVFPAYGLITIKGFNVFYVSGAKSIDRQYRTAGYDWFPNEELTREEQEECIKLYEELSYTHQIDVMLSHDCPQSIMEKITEIGQDRSSTRMLLQELYSINPPKYWVYGHHHYSSIYTESEVTFICQPPVDKSDPLLLMM